jgi:hypothetical protein
MKLVKERLLRYAAPALYEQMEETFAEYHIHSYDVHSTAVKSENGIDVTVKFSADFSQSVTARFSFEQMSQPDDDVKRFFQEAAITCKSLLISDYYKMMKL